METSQLGIVNGGPLTPALCSEYCGWVPLLLEHAQCMLAAAPRLLSAVDMLVCWSQTLVVRKHASRSSGPCVHASTGETLPGHRTCCDHL